MVNKLAQSLDFHANALVIRAERQRLIASNIANADTPGYVGRDLDFRQTMRDAMDGKQLSLPLTAPDAAAPRNPQHMRLQSSTTALGERAAGYTIQSQPAMDGNSVDLDRERANFVDNAVRYEATLRFLNGQSKTLLSAITGQ
jgi:flagellar basal-body rod protein FlgB